MGEANSYMVRINSSSSAYDRKAKRSICGIAAAIDVGKNAPALRGEIRAKACLEGP